MSDSVINATNIYAIPCVNAQVHDERISNLSLNLMLEDILPSNTSYSVDDTISIDMVNVIHDLPVLSVPNMADPFISFTLLDDNPNNHSSLNHSAIPFNPLALAPNPNKLLVRGGLCNTRKLNTDQDIMATLLIFSIIIALLLFCFIVKDVYLKFSPRVNIFNSIQIGINYEIPIIIVNNEDDYVDIDYTFIAHPEPNLNPLAAPFHPMTSQNLYNNISNVNDVYSILNDIRVKNIHRVIISHLNINSIRNKFVALSDMVKNKIDIMLISETKLDTSFPNSQFHIDGFSPPYRADRTNRGGGLLLYVRNDIPSKELRTILIPTDKECIFIEINLFKKKWLICGFYNPHKNQIGDHISFLSKSLDYYLSYYDNIIILGDFN